MARTPRLLAAAAISAAVLAASGAAMAQSAQPCASREALAQKLGSEFGKAVAAAGVDAEGNLVQVFSNKDSGTWTIAVTLPGGPSCIVSSGEGWADSDQQLAEIPKPAPRPDWAS